jgi:hypothetical protein
LQLTNIDKPFHALSITIASTRYEDMEQESKGWTDEHESIRSPKIQRKIKLMEDCRTTSVNWEE